MGLEFSARVLESIEKIELNPFGYEIVYGEARKAELVVIASLHGKRDRKLARERAFEVIRLPEPERPL